MRERLLPGFCARMRARFWDELFRDQMEGYRRAPERFAEEVLGSIWWSKQRQVARALLTSRRVAVKSANGVGKTYLAADLVLWFLYTFRPSLVLTTAPTRRQVQNLLWEEIRRRWSGARMALPGKLTTMRLRVGDGWQAIGLATNDGVRFQGFHAEHLLVVFDEASGIPDTIWEAVEGVAVGRNNRILAIGNPLRTSGRFHALFRSGGGWKRLTISALEHPNVRCRGGGIPGAVTAQAVQERVEEWCERLPGSCSGERCASSAFRWRGHWYKPNNPFRMRVLGEFPESDEEALIAVSWVEEAMSRSLPAVGERRMAVDVARFGSDCTVIGCRVGPVVTRMEVIHGADTMEVSGRIIAMAYEEAPETISVDVIGVGGGVVDKLVEEGIAGIVPVNVGSGAQDRDRFANLRAELYWNLRERLRKGEIALPQDEELVGQLAGIRYTTTSTGKTGLESKQAMRKRGMGSPDKADMLALLFADLACVEAAAEAMERATPSAITELRRGMAGW